MHSYGFISMNNELHDISVCAYWYQECRLEKRTWYLRFPWQLYDFQNTYLPNSSVLVFVLVCMGW